VLRYLRLHEHVKFHPPRSVKALECLIEHALCLRILNLIKFCLSGDQYKPLAIKELTPVIKRITALRLEVLLIEAYLAETSTPARALPMPANSFNVTVLQACNEAISLNDYHYRTIHNSWEEFCRQQPNKEDLASGRVPTHRSNDTEEAWCAIQSGTHVEAREVMNIGPIESQFRFACIIACIHQLLVPIEALHIGKNALPTSSDELDRRLGLRFVPNIRGVRLVEVCHDIASTERLQFMENWTTIRKGDVEEAAIEECDEVVHEFERGLEQRAVVPHVTNVGSAM
jgi:hypothetical protein